MLNILYIVYSVKPVVEKAPLVIPLIQQNRWLNARKPEDLEADDSDNREIKSEKVAVIQQTGDRVTDAAVQEILGTVSNWACWFLLNLGHIFVEYLEILEILFYCLSICVSRKFDYLLHYSIW